MANQWPLMTDEEFECQYRAAVVRGRVADTTEPRAAEAFYDRDTGRIVVELKNGCLFAFPTEREQGLEDATPDQLAAVEVDLGGEGLHWEELDADISVPGLVAHYFNIQTWAAKYLGRRTSPGKARAAQIDGRTSGRPRKHSAG